MKPLPLYVLLVGLPVSGVSLVVRLGPVAPAPPSFGGAWTVDAPPLVPGCSAPDANTAPGGITVQQSGPRLTLIVHDSTRTRLAGHITAEGLTASPSAGAAEGSAPTILGLDAVVHRDAAPDRMEGQLIVGGCGTRTTLPFTATREARDDGTGAP